MNTLRYQFDPLSGKVQRKGRVKTNQFLLTVHEDCERTKEIKHEKDMAEIPTEQNLHLNLECFFLGSMSAWFYPPSFLLFIYKEIEICFLN